MSEETQGRDGNAGAGAGEDRATVYQVEVKCPRPVYRRAGFAFVRGKNTLENVTPEQLVRLRSDPVLSLVSETPASPDGLPGRVDVLDVDSLNQRIRAAVAGLDKTSPDHFTQAGAPRVAAVCEALGETITAAQLKAAMENAAE